MKKRYLYWCRLRKQCVKRLKGSPPAEASGRSRHWARLITCRTRSQAGFKPKGPYKNKPFRAPRQKQLPANFQPTGAEIKAIDIPNANNAFRTPGVANNIILLNGIQAAAGFFNRIGARCEMKNLHIRGNIQNIATGLVSTLRMIIVYDRQPTGALPVITDILQARDQTGAVTTTGNSEINLDNRDRFTIVRDVEWYAPPVTNTAGVLTNGPNFPGEDAQFDVNIFIKLRGLGVHFKSTSNPTTIVDIATGALYAAFVSSNADNAWAANVSFRLRFDDK